MNSDENVQKAVEASKEFISEHPSVPTVDVESPKPSQAFAPRRIHPMQLGCECEECKGLSRELPVPPLVRVTRELNELRAAANELSGVIGKTVGHVGDNREPWTYYYPLNAFAFANAVERLREILEKAKL